MKYRLVALFSGLALAVSLLFGLIGGVSFGLILVRGLLGAAAFAALGFGTAMIFERYLPGLTAEGVSPLQMAEEEDESAEGYGGESVDIVLPEELPRQEGEEFGELGSAEEIQPVDEGKMGADEYTELESVGIDGAASMESEPETLEPEEFAEQGVDTLPNFETLGSMTGDLGDEAVESLGPSGPMSGGSRRDVEVLGHETDPQEAAKAVRTWLKKDEV